MSVIARIIIETPAGRKIVRELVKHRKLMKIKYPEIVGLKGEKTYTEEEVFNECYDILSEYYGVDLREL